MSGRALALLGRAAAAAALLPEVAGLEFKFFGFGLGGGVHEQRSSEAGPLNFFLWNPHWQCFVYNQSDCAGHVLTQMRETLKAGHVDFASGIMLEVENLDLPEGYNHTRHDCGQDRVDLIYDSRRWQAIHEAKLGCMDTSDRPFVVQEFVPVGSDADAEPLAIIAAHFPHPNGVTDYSGFAKKIADTAGKALKEVLDASPKLQRVALIADTNTHSNHPSSEIAEWLGMPAGPVEASELRHTCCLDNGFLKSMTFDRVIANFGTKIETQVWFDDGKDLPSWTCQRKHGSTGAFHKPVLATLHLDGAVAKEVAQRLRHSEGRDDKDVTDISA